MTEKTGKVINNKYAIGKMMGRDGVHEVYQGTQLIAEGIERIVALKLLHNWAAIAERDRARRIEEIATNAEIGCHPHITSVCDCGIDPEFGPWVAMEMAKGSLEQHIGPEPANPAKVQTVMVEMLQALMFVHEREKPLIHNNIKPRSILQLTATSWVLGNFNLAANVGSEQTLSEVTVKYASPEVLNVDLGEVGAASDLYSLGLCLYELALGQKRFEESLPSVYGSTSDNTKRGSSENDKWIYWHVSPQLTLPPLKDQLPDFPVPLSDSIEWMLRKSPKERASSARVVYDNISNTQAIAGSSWEQPQETGKQQHNPTMMKALLAIIGVALIGGIALVGLSGLLGGPTIPTLIMEQKYESRERFAKVAGKVDNLAPGSRLILTAGKDLLQSRAEAKVDSDTGSFSVSLELPVLGGYEGLCGVVNPQGKVVATTLFSIVRYPPEKVRVDFVTRPAAFGAEVLARQLVTGKKKGELVPAGKISRATDQEGRCILTIPYGPYELQVNHPRYHPYRRTLETELGKNKPIELRLVFLPAEEVEAKRQALRDEYESLKARAAKGDPEAIRRMAEIQKKLAQLSDEPGSSVDGDTATNDLTKQKAIQEERMALLKEAQDLAARAAAGDPEAIKRLQEINRRLEKLDKEEATLLKSGPTSDDELRALAKQRAELARRAAAGDPEAIAALEKLDAKLRKRGIDPNNITAGIIDKQTARDARRTAIEKRMQALAARVAAGDPEAIAEMSRLKNELTDIDEADKRVKKRQQIQEQMNALRARAAAGDPEAIAKLKQLQKQLDAVDAEEAEATTRKRQNILAEMDSLRARAAAGDPEAIARLKELQKQLKVLDASEQEAATAKNRQKIIEEMNALRVAAAAGDPAAIAKMQALKKQLDALDATEQLGGGAEGRQALIKRIEELRKRAAAGDPEAIRELKELERKSEILKALSEGRISPEQADQLLRNAQKLSAFARKALMSMDLNTLKQYISDDLPRGAISVSIDSVLNKLHVRGVVLDQEELIRVMMRLAPAEERLLLDIRVDPESLVDRLQAALLKHSITGATAHPFVIGPRHSLFVALPPETPKSKVKAAQLILEEFMAATDRATVRAVPMPVEPLGKGGDE